MPFLIAKAVLPFLSGSGQYGKHGNLEQNMSHVASDVSLKTEPALYASLQVVY
jgi:hypothetical protein